MSWSDGRLVAFDVETTGVDVDEARIVTAAIARCGGGQPVDTAGWLADPGVPIPDEAAQVHGITTEQAQADGQPSAQVIAEVLDALTERMPGAPIVAFNARFDLTILDREARRHGLVPLVDRGPLLVVDPFVIDKHSDQFRRGKRTLGVMCEHYGVTLDEAHAAGADALAAARLAWRMARRITELQNLTLVELHAQQVLWAAEQAASLEDYFRRQGRDETCERQWPIVDPPAEAIAA